MSDPSDTGPAGVRLTHPGKVLFPAMGVTKRQLAAYYEAVGDPLLAHARGRPLSLVRCPDGRDASCFFQKHAGPGLPAEIGTFPITEKQGGTRLYPVLRDVRGLVACAQVGVLELHLWASRADRLERPDRLVFDLDPGPDVPFAEVRRAALDLRDRLAAAGLASFALLTGGKGIHVVVPVERRVGWTEFTCFARGAARALARQEPRRFVAVADKAARAGRIFIDYLRNARGSTAIAPFSPRAREGAPVAVPVAWARLDGIERSAAFTLADTRAILGQAEAWADYTAAGNRLSRKAADALGIDADDTA